MNRAEKREIHKQTVCGRRIYGHCEANQAKKEGIIYLMANVDALLYTHFSGGHTDVSDNSYNCYKARWQTLELSGQDFAAKKHRLD